LAQPKGLSATSASSPSSENTPSMNSNKGNNQLSATMPVQFLKGVGPAKAKIFSKLNIETLSDLQTGLITALDSLGIKLSR